MTCVIVGCGDDGNDTVAEEPATELALEGDPYLLSSNENWELKDAVDVGPGSTATEIDPSMEWFAEYERFPDPDSSQLVVVSRHDETIAQLQERYSPDTAWRDVDSGGAQTIVGTEEDGPTVVLAKLEDGDTLSVLSGELSPDELLEWAATLESTTAEGWTAKGGIVQS